jgi:hypothetical protein
MPVDLKFYNDVNEFVNTGSSLFSFIPTLATDLGRLKLDIGLNLDIKYGRKSFTKIYPDVNLDLTLVNEMLYAYAKIVGGSIRNNLRDISSENPFINTESLMLSAKSITTYTNRNFQFDGGIRGSVTKNISYNLAFTSCNFETILLFVNDTTSKVNNRFILINDNAKFMRLKAEVSFQQSEKLSIILKGNYYSYDMDEQKKAWHKPGYDICLTGRYAFNNKIIIKADFFGLFQMYARTFNKNVIGVKEPIAKKLDDIYDVNLGGEYKITKQFSAFININNIGNFRYNKWYNYPSQRFNFMGGIAYAF